MHEVQMINKAHLPHGAHESHHIGNVVLGEQLRGQGVVLLEHHVQHGARVAAARGALALAVHGAQCEGVLLALQPQRAGGYQRHSEARSAGGEHTVKPAFTVTAQVNSIRE